MIRSKWKNKLVIQNLNVVKNSSLFKFQPKTVERSSRVLPHFVGKEFFIHNGKSFRKVFVNSKMIGYKFGQFCFTKKNEPAS